MDRGIGRTRGRVPRIRGSALRLSAIGFTPIRCSLFGLSWQKPVSGGHFLPGPVNCESGGRGGAGGGIAGGWAPCGGRTKIPPILNRSARARHGLPGAGGQGVGGARAGHSWPAWLVSPAGFGGGNNRAEVSLWYCGHILRWSTVGTLIPRGVVASPPPNFDGAAMQ